VNNFCNNNLNLCNESCKTRMVRKLRASLFIDGMHNALNFEQ
jgi:hypothetical protein